MASWSRKMSILRCNPAASSASSARTAPDKVAREKALGLLGKMGLAGVADDLVSDLPYGQQKLVGVARALMGDAKCLLLDEPMAGVEGQAYAAMQRVVREVAEGGVAV